MRYCDDGASRSTTTPPNARCAPSPWAGKNYLFAGSDAGGERAAAIYSLIGTAKLNGLDPEAYLREVLRASPTIRSSASTSCCLGTSPPAYRPQSNPQPKQSLLPLKNSALVPVSLPNIAESITYGEITIGVLRPVGCVATATDGHRNLAMLVRRRGETLAQLLTRLDQAIDKALTEDIYTDEINPP